MTRIPYLPKPFKVYVLFGLYTIELYDRGERCRSRLSQDGTVKLYQFATLPELNAFTHGVVETSGFEHTVPVEDLT